MNKLLQRYIKFINHKSLIGLYDFFPVKGENAFIQESSTLIGEV